MDASEPRVRRRGFFLHTEASGEPDAAEHENPEGVAVRARSGRASLPRRISGLSLSGRSHTSSRSETSDPQIRSGSVTGSRQRAHLPR